MSSAPETHGGQRSGISLPHILNVLTGRELRLLIMTLDDRSSPQDIADGIGRPRSAIASTQAEIRQKLGVRHGQTLREFVAELGAVARVFESRRWFRPCSVHVSERNIERRQKDLLRRSIADLQLVADRARAYARALDAVLPAIAGDELFTATEERISLLLLAGDLDELVERVILRERRQRFADREQGRAVPTPVPR